MVHINLEPFDRELIRRRVPEAPGVYWVYKDQQMCLYVGATENLRDALLSDADAESQVGRFLAEEHAGWFGLRERTDQDKTLKEIEAYETGRRLPRWTELNPPS